MNKDNEVAVLGMGCFWCTEAVFQDVEGVLDIEVGFAGGRLDNPTYRDVINNNTGHIEVAKITFDPEVIHYRMLIDMFWTAHDPTSRDRQGNDVGEQYRSVVFYLNEEQKGIAEASMENAQKFNEKPIVTEIKPLNDNYYPAENYHREYYSNNPNAGYCRMVIDPKVRKFRKKFQEHLKNR